MSSGVSPEIIGECSAAFTQLTEPVSTWSERPQVSNASLISFGASNLILALGVLPDNANLAVAASR